MAAQRKSTWNSPTQLATLVGSRITLRLPALGLCTESQELNKKEGVKDERENLVDASFKF